ncbi:MAG: anti-sigma regulatory factor [Planctomycetes bacterium]|nr:anti-sigma regulatory factor [Planctomycetota bacterium]
MPLSKRDLLPIRAETDIVMVRQAVRKACIEQGFSLVEQTKFVTAASEIARNTLEYGGGGEAALETHIEGVRKGVRIVFTDQGPGIADLEQAMRDGFTTGGGMGHGLGGAKRLVEHFEITSTPGVGTTVAIARWK